MLHLLANEIAETLSLSLSVLCFLLFLHHTHTAIPTMELVCKIYWKSGLFSYKWEWQAMSVRMIRRWDEMSKQDLFVRSSRITKLEKA